MPIIVPLNPIDVRDRLANLLAGNALITTNFPNPIKKRDVGTAPPPTNMADPATGVTLCLALPGMGTTDDTLGGNGFGTDIKIVQLALLIYVWVPEQFKPNQDSESIKQACTDLCVIRTT